MTKLQLKRFTEKDPPIYRIKRGICKDKRINIGTTRPALGPFVLANHYFPRTATYITCYSPGLADWTVQSRDTLPR
jgi:hypothetical protein